MEDSRKFPTKTHAEAWQNRACLNLSGEKSLPRAKSPYGGERLLGAHRGGGCVCMERTVPCLEQSDINNDNYCQCEHKVCVETYIYPPTVKLVRFQDNLFLAGKEKQSGMFHMLPWVSLRHRLRLE